LAVPAALDRAAVGPGGNAPPAPDEQAYQVAQADACLALGRVLLRLDRRDAARAALERAIREAPQSDAAAQARELLERR
ncbi:MAG: hypothetical protein HZB39_05420, partial [Planctomycetes bacterium]|nr:hypothetical protein [Planctomycetota bacterium]